MEENDIRKESRELFQKGKEFGQLLFQKGKETVRGAAASFVGEENEKEKEQAIAQQQFIDLVSAVRSYISLGIDDIKIMELLSDFFGCDSLKEMKLIIQEAKIQNKIIDLQKHIMEASDISDASKANFVFEYNVNEELHNDPRLLDLSPKDLKEEILRRRKGE